MRRPAVVHAVPRLEGLYQRIVPLRDPGPDVNLLRRNLLELGEYRGYVDSTVRIDDFTPNISYAYVSVAKKLLAADMTAGAAGRAQCRDDRRRFVARFDPARGARPVDVRELLAACGS